MITIDVPKQINKEIEHFKVEHELKDKRDAIILLLKQCMINQKDLAGIREKLHEQRIDQFQKLFREADKTKRHNLTPEQIEVMDSDIYD